MQSFLRRLGNAVLTAFLAVSATVATLWFVRFSGIIWTTPVAFTDSLWTVMLSLAKYWGPIFVPTAAVLFVVKMFEKNIAHDIIAALKPEIGRQVEGAVVAAMSGAAGDKIAARVTPRIRRHSLLAIQCVFRALARRPALSPESVVASWADALRDFERRVASRAVWEDEQAC